MVTIKKTSRARGPRNVSAEARAGASFTLHAGSEFGYPRAMDRQGLLAFLRQHRLCVQASVAAEGAPQAAVVGYAVSDRLELIFDTLASTRKAQNLRRDARIAVVVGWEGEQTLQIEGLADEPSGDDLQRLKRVYLAAFPDGVERESWPGISYLRVRPHWARFSDFGAGGSVVEFDERALGAR